MKLYFLKLRATGLVTRQNIFLQPLRNYGYKITEIEPEEMIEKSKEPNCLIMVWEWYYKDIISNLNLLHEHHDKFNSKIILLAEHPWEYEKELSLINNFLKEKNIKSFINFFQNSEGLYDQYTMMECASLHPSELWFQHDFIFYIINDWLEKRKTKLMSNNFLYLSGGRLDEFRQEFLRVGSDIKEKLSLHIEHGSNVEKLYHKAKIMKSLMDETFNGQNYLGGFGNGLPPLELYEKSQVEIAIETMHQKNYCHITEKTWRPFLCKMPVIIIMGEGNYNKLLEIGYQIPFPNFYEEYFSLEKISDKVKFFYNFLIENKDQDNFFDTLSKTADYNFQHFWHKRSKIDWKDLINQHKKIFGFSPLEESKNNFFTK